MRNAYMQNLMFAGRMCSGKTTCADILVKYYGYQKISLAAPIKAVVHGMVAGGSAEDLLQEHVFSKTLLSTKQQAALIEYAKKSMEIPSEAPKYRERLQYFGTEAGRDGVDQRLWINCLLGSIKSGHWVIDDVRFFNEWKQLVNNFIGISLWVSQPIQHKRLISLYGNYNPEILNHASESEFTMIDNYIPLKHKINANNPLNVMEAELLYLVDHV